MKPEENFKKALIEAAMWELNLTEKQMREMPYTEARRQKVDEIFKKYKNRIFLPYKLRKETLVRASQPNKH